MISQKVLLFGDTRPDANEIVGLSDMEIPAQDFQVRREHRVDSTKRKIMRVTLTRRYTSGKLWR